MGDRDACAMTCIPWPAPYCQSPWPAGLTVSSTPASPFSPAGRLTPGSPAPLQPWRTAGKRAGPWGFPVCILLPGDPVQAESCLGERNPTPKTVLGTQWGVYYLGKEENRVTAKWEVARGAPIPHLRPVLWALKQQWLTGSPLPVPGAQKLCCD